MSGLFVKLKYKCQQRQNKYAKSHKIFKVVLFHKHHLHSIKEMEGNPTLQVIGTKSISAITWSALANQLYPSDLLLECARNTVVKTIYHINKFLAILCNLRYKSTKKNVYTKNLYENT